MGAKSEAARAVIGAGWGDEAKGATVDRLVAGPGSVVVRHNGGAQAGHTVVAADGRRHVFHHVGSGAFRGAATFLSRHFASSPVHFLPELAELGALGVRPVVRADRRGLLTTPYDMLVNQVVETARGGARHGSTGYGFGETVERAGRGFGTTLDDLGDEGALLAKLARIRDEWVPARLEALGVASIPAEYADLLSPSNEALAEAFLVAAERFSAAVGIEDDARALWDADQVVFEGAQGLALDQARGAFPFVTRSFTGIRNVLEIAAEADIRRVEATYATRCYATRHGAGPFPGEAARPPVPGFADPTNVPNAWQGSLRFAPLDVDALSARIAADIGDAGGTGVEVAASLTVTCLDQAGPALGLVSGGRSVTVPTDDATAFILRSTGLASGTEAWGPSGADSRPIGAARLRAA